VLVSNSPYTNIGMVADGLGLASVPASTIGDAERCGRIRRIRVQPEIAPVAVALVYRDGAQDNERVSALRVAAGTSGADSLPVGELTPSPGARRGRSAAGGRKRLPGRTG
jgi:DNA-binding transcriptional LysR family regulator